MFVILVILLVMQVSLLITVSKVWLKEKFLIIIKALCFQIPSLSLNYGMRFTTSRKPRERKK